ncbi:PIR protein, putative [Plasmodium sp.]|nr:PIR protein, putative [Plasmodium sp.]
MKLIHILHTASNTLCETQVAKQQFRFCLFKEQIKAKRSSTFLKATAEQTNKATQNATLTKAGEDESPATSSLVSNFFNKPIGISIIVIIIIVILLLIIYLILRYRRKKKMKKKLQYIKLLKE